MLADPDSPIIGTGIKPYDVLREPNGSEVEKNPDGMSIYREESITRKVAACGTIRVKVRM